MTVIPIQAELTIQQAAHLVGTHRRVKFQDLMSYWNLCLDAGQAPFQGQVEHLEMRLHLSEERYEPYHEEIVPVGRQRASVNAESLSNDTSPTHQ